MSDLRVFSLANDDGISANALACSVLMKYKCIDAAEVSRNNVRVNNETIVIVLSAIEP